ncbi:transketolase [Amycolatopsis sp. GM8]|uniref:transketolase n=1 Tax=Amycolatopsis sp. GM8 TaxID=2896530 RepID=UPI001F3A676B|nr:transketolase [Amycolatopsis sp. GM8]
MTTVTKDLAAWGSTVDVLWVLFDRVLNVSPETVRDPKRDRFLLSDGHESMPYYAVLAAKGFLDPDELGDRTSVRSRLGPHPDRTRVPGAEISTGSPGHGLALALGTVFGLRAQRITRPKVMVLIGDAELDEGSNAEAIALAGRLAMDQLTAVVIDSASATHGWPGGIERRFAVECWATRVVDGHDHEALYDAFTAPHPAQPLCVVAVVEPARR